MSKYEPVMQSLWHVHPASPQRARALAAAARIDPITAQLLLNRGVAGRADAARFLHPDLFEYETPWALPDMERAVSRLRRAISKREPIVIFGDSDVDGLTSSVILYEALRGRGALVRARQSNRITDGYGLPHPLAQQLCRTSTKLLILVDCGTNQPDEIRLLAAHGIETIIVDHHVPLDASARPYALINPHCVPGAEPGSRRAGQELCSAGLAFKVAQAILDGEHGHGMGRGGASRAEMSEGGSAWLDLAALGTLADCAPLVGESRAIVAAGLPRIVRSHRLGLQRLCEATDTTSPDPEQVVRRLVPRLNASGRLGDATAIWRLLHSAEEDRLDDWMAAAEMAHGTTKRLNRQFIAQAEEQVSRLHFRDQFVMVLSRSGWHQGLMGPLASQLANRYGRPAVAIAMNERHGTGSGRSIPLFNLFQALRACRGLLVRFGGHAQACGLTVDRKHLEPFRDQLNHEASRSLGREGLRTTRTVDLELSLRDVRRRWVEETGDFMPFGNGNPRPTVILRRLTLEPTSPRIANLSDGTERAVVKARFGARMPVGTELAAGGRYDVVASPAVVSDELVLSVSAVRPSQPEASAGS